MKQQLPRMYKSSSLYMSVSTSLTPLQRPVLISCNLDLAAYLLLRTLPSTRATLCFQLPLPDWTPQPALCCWPAARVIAQFATGFAIFIFILFLSGKSIKQVRRPYLTNFKKLLRNVETLFEHAVTLRVRCFLYKKGSS